jgi:hypothetical protein
MPKPRIVEPPEELEIGKPRIIAASRGERRVEIPEKIFIHLYTDRSHSNLRLDEISDYLQSVLGKRAVIDVRGDFVKHHYGGNVPEKFIGDVIQAKIWAKKHGPFLPFDGIRPTREELAEDEKRILKSSQPVNELYGESREMVDKQDWAEKRMQFTPADWDYHETLRLHNALVRALKEHEKGDEHVHIVFTSRRLGSDELGFGRIHMRAGFFPGLINVVSTTGMVEAPYCSDEFKRSGKALSINDKRITEAAKHRAMQAVHSALVSGKWQLCRDERCSIFDHHDAKGTVEQIEHGGLCEKHDDFFKQIREGKREVIL